MPRRRVIIVGGVAAGPAAAAEARRTDPEAEIILIDKGSDISYSACEMPLFIAGEIGSDQRLVRFDAASFSKRFNVEVRLHTEVMRIDPASRHLDVSHQQSSGSETLWYDALVLATGVRAQVPVTLQAASHHVMTLRRLEDARLLRGRIEKDPAGHVVVVGAGYVGLDGVEAFSRAGWRVTLLAPRGRMLPRGLDESMSDVLYRCLEAGDLVVRSERATGFDVSPDGRIRAVRTDAGERIGCDMVLVATGTVPNDELARAAGISCLQAGGIIVSDSMQTSAPAVFACGDVVAHTELISGAKHHVPLALNAFRSGRVAGRNAARGGKGRAQRMGPVVHAAAVSVSGMEVAHTGWTLEAALDAGMDAVAVDVRHRSASSNAPNSPLYVRLVATRKDRRIVGGQLIGQEGAAQRINTLTALIRSGATVEDVYEVDYVYTPRLAPAQDALFVAARQLQKALDMG